MKFGIRFKLVALLMVVGVLPLMVALAVMVVGVGEMRKATIGTSFHAIVATQASRLDTTLRKEAEKLTAYMQEGTVERELAAVPAVNRPSAERAAIDARWQSLPEDSPEIRAVLDNPLADLLRHLQRIDPNCQEIVVTDRFGQLVAATRRTADYFQADEQWWTGAYNQGRGAAFIPPISVDSDIGIWGMSICVPIYSEQGGKTEVIGVAKALIALEAWMAQYTAAADRAQAQALLLHEDGSVIFPQNHESIADWSKYLTADDEGGWTIDGGFVRAYAPVRVSGPLGDVPLDAPRWYLVMQTPTSQALASLYWMSLYILAAGLALIGLAFAGGMYMANRSIIQPLERMRTVAAHVTAGDLSQRIIVPDDRLSAGDEIHELTNDLNHMFAALEASHAALVSASEMKSRFIRVAGHELRTPVGYIVGMAGLLARDAQSPQARSALEKLGAKGRRLEQIITGMFKLLPDLQWTSLLKYSTFSVSGLVDEIVAELKPFAEGRSQKLVAEAESGLPDIQADRDKLHDALANLMTNAIKFTPDGGTIKVAVGRRADERAVISVCDQGGGISREELPHIFEPFWGGADVLKHSSGEFGYQKRGAGLGLAVAKHFVRLHGGQLQVDTSSEGCTFTIILPITRPAGQMFTDRDSGLNRLVQTAWH